MVGDDDGLVAHLEGSGDDVAHAGVNGNDSLLDSFIYTRVSHHVAVCEVHDDEIVNVLADSFDKLVLHLVCRHLGLQVVGGDLRAGHEDAILALEGSLASAVEEEGYVCVLLRFGGVELAQSTAAEVFAESVIDILLWEEDVYALE